MNDLSLQHRPGRAGVRARGSPLDDLLQPLSVNACANLSALVEVRADVDGHAWERWPAFDQESAGRAGHLVPGLTVTVLATTGAGHDLIFSRHQIIDT